jgi:DNA-directed RNA polymerase specialized sigma24 family protein
VILEVAIAAFEGRGRFLSWLFRIAYQLYITEQRSPRSGAEHVELADDIEDPFDRVNSTIN